MDENLEFHIKVSAIDGDPREEKGSKIMFLSFPLILYMWKMVLSNLNDITVVSRTVFFV